jgi:hypothetical protein
MFLFPRRDSLRNQQQIAGWTILKFFDVLGQPTTFWVPEK